jgi:hypothetical protein
MPGIQWKRAFTCPYISPQANTVAPDAVTTPDCLVSGGAITLFVGGVASGKERILQTRLADFNPDAPANHVLSSASLVIDTGPDAFDCNHVYDPAALSMDHKIYLYYSASGTGPDSIGLAISETGKEYIKVDHPVLVGRSPEIVWTDGTWRLFYVNRPLTTGYRIFSAASTDGVTFQPVSSQPILEPGPAGTWDTFEVTTPRIFRRGSWFYMVYAASRSAERQDLPEAFGLARSQDLVHWEKYPHNPVFSIAKDAYWDSGAIWFGTVFEWKDWLILLYEGGRMADIAGHNPALTQMGLARLACRDFDLAMNDWKTILQ